MWESKSQHLTVSVNVYVIVNSLKNFINAVLVHAIEHCVADKVDDMAKAAQHLRKPGS